MNGWKDRPLHSKSRLIDGHKGESEGVDYGRRKGFRRYKISSVGQMTLPASARHEWGIEGPGVVEVAHLGNAVVILPSGGSALLLDAWLDSKELQSEAAQLLGALARRPSSVRADESDKE